MVVLQTTPRKPIHKVSNCVTWLLPAPLLVLITLFGILSFTFLFCSGLCSFGEVSPPLLPYDLSLFFPAFPSKTPQLHKNVRNIRARTNRHLHVHNSQSLLPFHQTPGYPNLEIAKGKMERKEPEGVGHDTL